MNVAIKAGVILAVAVSLVSAIWLGSGLYQNQALGAVPIVIFIALTVGVIVWALRQTAAESGYGKQVLNALMIGIVAAVGITFLSWVMQSFVFTEAMEFTRQFQLDQLETQNLPDDQYEAAIKVLDVVTSPFVSALIGGIFTVITSFVTGLIVGFFQRRT